MEDDSSEEEQTEDEVLDLSGSESDEEVADEDFSESEDESYLEDVADIPDRVESGPPVHESPIDDTFPVNKPLPPLPSEDDADLTDLNQTKPKNDKQEDLSTYQTEKDDEDNAVRNSTDNDETKQSVGVHQRGKLLPVFSVDDENEDLPKLPKHFEASDSSSATEKTESYSNDRSKTFEHSSESTKLLSKNDGAHFTEENAGGNSVPKDSGNKAR